LARILGAEFATALPDQVVDNAAHATFVSHMEVMANDTAGMGTAPDWRQPP